MNQELLHSIIHFSIVLLIGVAAHLLFFRIIYYYGKKKDIENWIQFVKKLRWSSFFFLLSIVSYYANVAFSLSSGIEVLMQKFILCLNISFFTWMLISANSLFMQAFQKRYNVNQANNLEARKAITQIKVFQRIINIIILTIAIASILMTFDKIRMIGVNILASAGIAGIIIGFAAQKSIGMILAGIQIAITQPIRLDDVVIVENEWGRIEEITLTYVVIKIWDERRLIVPVNYFLEKPFQNWTRNSADITGSVYIHTDYYVPVDAIRKELTHLLSSHPDWDGRVNNVQVTKCSADSMELRALMSSSNATKNWDLRTYIRESLVNFIAQNYPGTLPRSRVVIESEKA